jgi:7-cyano-7-deazaguanine synthase in queuosine biosynthesis
MNQNSELLSATVDLLNKLHGWPMPGCRPEYLAAMEAALNAGADIDEKLCLVVKAKEQES